MRTPDFRVADRSEWRLYVIETWKFLRRHYEISQRDSECSTSICVAQKPSYDLRDVKLIAQAAIHFEPAWEALMPNYRRESITATSSLPQGLENARSNWLSSPALAQSGNVLAQSVSVIEGAASVEDVARRFNGPVGLNSGGYAWNFWRLEGTVMVEFSKPPMSSNSDEVFAWTDRTLSFIHASRHLLVTRPLRHYPSTTVGLSAFLETTPSAALGGAAPPRLDVLNLPPAVAPLPVLTGRSGLYNNPGMLKMLKMLVDTEMQRIGCTPTQPNPQTAAGPHPTG
jgi:hypothetical protein